MSIGEKPVRASSIHVGLSRSETCSPEFVVLGASLVDVIEDGFSNDFMRTISGSWK
jgi:hypothetical protein